EGARKGFDSSTAIGASCGELSSYGTAGGADESDNRLLASSDVRGVETFCGRIDPLDSQGLRRHLLMKTLVAQEAHVEPDACDGLLPENDKADLLQLHALRIGFEEPWSVRFDWPAGSRRATASAWPVRLPVVGKLWRRGRHDCPESPRQLSSRRQPSSGSC